ncbi:MAG TPA: immune inhibitor A, partial [bacterium]|nr:immune inhibitor A [bacterium]
IGAPTNGPAAAVSGTNAAATSLSGNYTDNSNSLLVLNTPVTIPTSGTPKIEFMAWVNVEGNGYSPFDYMEVLVKRETDAGWPVLTGIVLSAATPSPLDALDNTKTKVTKKLGTAYYKFTGDLSPYKGKTVNIGFRFTSDASDNLEGIYLDDVTVK